MKKEYADGLSVDHGLLSPSGHMSKRARKRAQERTGRELFGDLSFPATPEQGPRERILQLRSRAAYLRDLAGRGMHPRKWPKEAARLEEEARLLEEANPIEKVS